MTQRSTNAMPALRGSPAALVALVLGGCATSDGGAQLLVPDQIGVDWDGSYNATDDGLGALVPLDVMVYDGASGRPLADVTVTLFVDDGEDVIAVPVDAASFVDPSLPESDTALWDSRHDQYLWLSPPSDTDGGRTVALSTDGAGLARWYLFVDAFPGDAAGFEPIPITVSNGADETFLLTPR
ncbi:MAG: hypothetical protein KC621_24295 [Myxococcales bacterium]|nr:hypothetical protein [Myxococcales bacterium]